MDLSPKYYVEGCPLGVVTSKPLYCDLTQCATCGFKVIL